MAIFLIGLAFTTPDAKPVSWNFETKFDTIEQVSEALAENDHIIGHHLWTRPTKIDGKPALIIERRIPRLITQRGILSIGFATLRFVEASEVAA